MLNRTKAEIIMSTEMLDRLVRTAMDQLYRDDPEGFDQTSIWAALTALSYDLPRVGNALKKV